MKKFSPPQVKEVSFPTPHTPHPTPYTLFSVRRQIHNTFACSRVPRSLITEKLS
jgi:hypothetical protein